MFKEIVKRTLPEFGSVMLLSSLIMVVIIGIALLTTYLMSFSIVIGLIVGVILFVGGFFLLFVLLEYIPVKYKQWKAKRNNVLE